MPSPAWKAPFAQGVAAFNEGYAVVIANPQHQHLPVICGSYEWRRAMYYEVGRRLDEVGWHLPDLVREAERRAYGYVKGGGNSVSCSIASPNSIRRLWAALERVEGRRPLPAPTPRAQDAPEGQGGGLSYSQEVGQDSRLW